MTGLKTSLYFHTYKVILHLQTLGCRLYKITNYHYTRYFEFVGKNVAHINWFYFPNIVRTNI